MVKLTRRTVLSGLGRAGLATWLGAELALDALAEPSEPTEATGTEGGILRARLLATRLDAMRDFYGRTLGWPVERHGESLVVRAGGTLLQFDPTPADDAPYYHVAWAIPSNKLGLGKAWLAARVPLLVHPDGRDEFHFKNARRKAVYFADPAGNVLELIARYELGDRAGGDFGLDDLLYVNHAGLVVDDMDAAIQTLSSALGLAPTAPPLPTFTKLGDVYRHLVLVPRERLWLPEMNRGAEVYPADVVLHSPVEREVALDPLPYRVQLAQSLRDPSQL